MKYGEVIAWLDHQGRVSDLMVQTKRNSDGQVDGFEIISVDRMQIRSAESLLEELADIPVIEITDTDEQALWVQITRAKSMIAHRSKRAMGNSMLSPCDGGCLLMYVGSNSYDRAAMWVADQQYVAVNEFHNYFVFLKGDPTAIQNAFVSLREKLNEGA